MPRTDARRPAAAVPAGAGPAGAWLRPWWSHRQVDPASPAWLPADEAAVNSTGRSWTVIGIPEGDRRWRVDPRGLLVAEGDAWALDWWVGAEDRWHTPSTDAAVRQHLVDAAPVVETAMRVPGGDVVVRHWAVPAAGGADGVVMEIENASAAPVAVAVSLRPFGLDGPVHSKKVAADGAGLSADGVRVLRAGVRARQAAVSDGPGGDVAAVVLANATPDVAPAEVDGPEGTLTAAVVWPLAHRATLRLEVPGNVAAGRSRAFRDRPGGGPPVGAPSASPDPAVPGPEDTARGWTARVGRETGLDLPDGPLASAVAAQRRHLLLTTPADRPTAAAVAVALTTAGLREEAAGLIDGWLDAQTRRGRLGESAADTGASLWALATWAATGADDGLVARSPLAIGRSAELLASDRSRRPGAVVWRAAGLRAAVALLSSLGERDAAAQAAGWADLAVAGVRRAVAPCPSTGVLPALAGLDEWTAAGLLAVSVGLVLPGDGLAAAVVARAADRSLGLPPGAVAGPEPFRGASPEAALRAAVAGVGCGREPAETMRWVLSAASSTWTWPTLVHPRLATGAWGSGADPGAGAALWAYGRSLLVDDDLAGPRPAGSPVRLRLLPVWPADWIGRDLEVHGLPTAAGSLSYAVRWHGERPALLWDLGAGDDVALSCGSDPAWAVSDRRGETLLAPVAVP